MNSLNTLFARLTGAETDQPSVERPTDGTLTSLQSAARRRFGLGALALTALLAGAGCAKETEKDTASASSDEPGLDLGNPSDSDGDGLNDDYETEYSNTDPQQADTDDDGVSDGDEVAAGTNPNSADSDGDGAYDGAEIAAGTDPNDPADYEGHEADNDDDSDGLSNADEATLNTDPDNPDTDGDGYADGVEVEADTDPKDEEVPGYPILSFSLNTMHPEADLGVSVSDGTLYGGTEASPQSLCELAGLRAATDAVGYWYFENGGPGACPEDLDTDLTCDAYDDDYAERSAAYMAPWSDSGWDLSSNLSTAQTYSVTPTGTSWDTTNYNPGWVIHVECAALETID